MPYRWSFSAPPRRQEVDAVSEIVLERSPVPRAAPAPPESSPGGAPPGPLTSARIVTSLLVAGPLVALAVFLPLGWGGTATVWGLGLAAVFYVFTGFGIERDSTGSSPTEASVRSGASRSCWPWLEPWRSRDR